MPENVLTLNFESLNTDDSGYSTVFVRNLQLRVRQINDTLWATSVTAKFNDVFAMIFVKVKEFSVWIHLKSSFELPHSSTCFYYSFAPILTRPHKNSFNGSFCHILSPWQFLNEAARKCNEQLNNRPWENWR